ncbi:phage antirepressor KilAC domain-containing protein [Bacillus sp. JCM 19034]|uniref:phage antirepressor n=1 Tax=Bacillus sp. JCM 19034 TaxID=1481928 RepID=UPI000785EC4F|nr:phage antirepressor KilAC domain-containing protein [Bacillus sp. JCM 19034]
MIQLQKVFDYEDQQVRTVVIDKKVWFVASDVCKVLEIKNVTQAIQRLEEDERSMFNIGRQGSVNIVDESGLYELILSSRKKEAKEFKRWIKRDVLPSIRKTGSYTIETPSYMVEDPIKRAELWIEEQKKVQLLEQRAAIYEEKANYVDEILKSKNTVTTTQIAKDYGMSATALNRILKEEGIQYKVRGQWVLKSGYHDKGYTKSYTVDIERSDGTPDVKMNTHWTQKGRLFIHRVLEKRGVVAMMDQELMSG